MTVEVNYNGSRGTNPQANLLNPNQVPMSVVEDLINRFGTAQAIALLNSQITSAQAIAAGYHGAVCELHERERADESQRGAGAASVPRSIRPST